MVFRKPYAFLIKHFKLIHFIISALLILIVIKNRELYLFIKSCIKNINNKYNASEYINYGIIIYIIIAIILLFIIYWLLKHKDKPRNIYIFSIIIYSSISIVIFTTYSYMAGFSSNIISAKTIRLYRDILFITNILQYIIIFFMAIRTLGFDIKKFNFSTDIHELNLTDEDGEEFEVNVLVDTNSVMRVARKQKRELGYFYQEYKGYIITIILIILLILGFKGYTYFNTKLKVYSENEIIGTNNYLNITNSYYADDNYIIIKFKISKSGVKEKLNIGSLILTIDGKKYSPNKNICSKYQKIGYCYKQQYITSSPNTYILVYEIPNKKYKNIYLTYKENYEKIYKVKLNPQKY